MKTLVFQKAKSRALSIGKKLGESPFYPKLRGHAKKYAPQAITCAIAAAYMYATWGSKSDDFYAISEKYSVGQMDAWKCGCKYLNCVYSEILQMSLILTAIKQVMGKKKQ